MKPYRGQPTKAVREAQAAIGARSELLGLVDDYRRLKHERSLIEFADQMAQAAALAEEAPEVAQHDSCVSGSRWCCSTSTKTPPPRRPDCCGHSSAAGTSVTAVGDPFQAIYGWRGAVPSNILQFGDDFRQVDGRPPTASRCRPIGAADR